MKRIQMIFPVLIMILLTGCRQKDYNHVQMQTDKPSYIETETAKSEELKEPEEPSAGLQHDEEEKQQNCIVIKAHVKEVFDDMILISSDSDSYPGAFEVKVPGNVYDSSRLSGGDFILVKLRETVENTRFDAVSILPVDSFENSAQEDILLTAAPSVKFSDLLSSTMNSFELLPGSYEWNYREQEEIRSIVACGTHPLDIEPGMANEKLDVPDYNQMGAVVYSLGCPILPDIITIKQWNQEDIGNIEAQPVSTVISYDYCRFVELQENMVYELTAEWNQNLSEDRGFYGTASYSFVTE